jgi:hypothetical protein
MDKPAILDWARERMASEEAGALETGYRYYHGLRVGALAVELGERLKLPVPPDLLYIAGVLHDVGKAGYMGQKPHGPRGAKLIRKHAGAWFEPEELERVCLMVENHYERPLSKWYADRQKPEWPDEVLVIQDADLIDHVGYNQVWRNFLIARHKDRTSTEVISRFWRHERAKEWWAESHASLNFDVSRVEFLAREQRFIEFCRGFEIELHGRFLT